MVAVYVPRVIFVGFSVTLILMILFHRLYRMENIFPKKDLEALTRLFLFAGVFLLLVSFEKTLPCLTRLTLGSQESLTAFFPLICIIVPGIRKPKALLSPFRWLLLVTLLVALGISPH